MKIFTGAIPLGKKPAIFLIYQPNGIAPSTIVTLDWLHAHGFSPIVVANSPIADSDRALLLDHAARVMQRPNFGYDFGGYRDALRLVDQAEVDPEQLIILNDSVWVPMAPDVLTRMQAREDADLVGLLQDEKVIHDNRGGTPSDRLHVESYFYLFNRTALQSEAFKTFWRDYKMTDYKPHTIKFGELGFSRTMAAAGLRIDALSKRSIFLDQVVQQDDDFIALTLKYAAYGDNDLRRQGDKLRALPRTAPGWRAEVLEHIRKCVNRKRFNASFCYANDRIFGTMFMKKSSEEIFSEMRLQYLRAVRDGHLPPPPPEIGVEMAALVHRQFPGFRSEQPASGSI
ncbi:rhamnan synthesis F family protein [Pseudotabrizicola algicola]|uniref:rhamnan synthesis F family protein n=1 Tax=Pseudotabrizicola algicola TaxID=2709381 RepID=UPI00338DADB5